MKKNVLVVGNGDVGQAIARILRKKYKVTEKGRAKLERPDNVEVMHICYPYDSKFEKEAVKYIKEYQPRLTIINSTVAVGTTQNIIKKTKRANIVHSPFIGDHNNLDKGLKTFKKIIGYETERAGNLAARHFKSVGLKILKIKGTKTTELGKLLLTTQYALNIAFHQEMERMCQKGKIIFEDAITKFQKVYNIGYARLRPNISLPQLFPGFIGGKCLIPNLKILKEFYLSDFCEEILKSNRRKAHTIKTKK
jgi:UDP-N-acetyl-D-mannosaminuronate dehydrogenase